MSNLSAEDGKELQEKILNLIKNLEHEMTKLKLAQATELDELTKRCRNDIQKLHTAFTNEIDVIQANHELQLTALVEEIAYLKEMSNSQRMMMESNLDYIRELELRHPKT